VPSVPDSLAALVSQLLRKNPAERPQTTSDVLQRLQRSGSAEVSLSSAAPRRRRLAIGTAIAVGAIALVTWFAHRESRIRWALEEALPRVAELVEQNKFTEAFELALKVEQVAPKDPRLQKL